MTFFRVKLNAKDIAMANRTTKLTAVLCNRNGVVVVLALIIKRVEEVESCVPL